LPERPQAHGSQSPQQGVSLQVVDVRRSHASGPQRSLLERGSSAQPVNSRSTLILVLTSPRSNSPRPRGTRITILGEDNSRPAHGKASTRPERISKCLVVVQVSPSAINPQPSTLLSNVTNGRAQAFLLRVRQPKLAMTRLSFPSQHILMHRPVNDLVQKNPVAPPLP
jgi:hypothetical protein